MKIDTLETFWFNLNRKSIEFQTETISIFSNLKLNHHKMNLVEVVCFITDMLAMNIVTKEENYCRIKRFLYQKERKVPVRLFIVSMGKPLAALVIFTLGASVIFFSMH